MEKQVFMSYSNQSFTSCVPLSQHIHWQWWWQYSSALVCRFVCCMSVSRWEVRNINL